MKAIGFTRAADMTPRKKQLYAELNQAKKITSILKSRLLKKSATFRNLFPKGDPTQLLKSGYFKNLDKLSDAAKTFILSQLRNIKKKRSIRWTAEEKSLALAMYKHAPKGYRFLQKIFSLPSAKTLQRSLASIVLKPGLNEDLLNHIQNISKSLKKLDKYCLLLFDEV